MMCTVLPKSSSGREMWRFSKNRTIFFQIVAIPLCPVMRKTAADRRFPQNRNGFLRKIPHQITDVIPAVVKLPGAGMNASVRSFFLCFNSGYFGKTDHNAVAAHISEPPKHGVFGIHIRRNAVSLIRQCSKPPQIFRCFFRIGHIGYSFHHIRRVVGMINIKAGAQLPFVPGLCACCFSVIFFTALASIQSHRCHIQIYTNKIKVLSIGR